MDNFYVLPDYTSGKSDNDKSDEKIQTEQIEHIEQIKQTEQTEQAQTEQTEQAKQLDQDHLDRIISDVKNNKSIFVVENGFNTCYISSLLMALFYKASYLDSMLLSETVDPIHIYLQEIIKTKFVDRVRSGVSVMSEIMNEIRTFANVCGWLNHEELMEQQDVNEFFAFLADITKLPQIEIQRQTLTEGIQKNDDIGKEEFLSFINLPVPGTVDEISVKELLNEWMNNNTVDIQREIITETGQKIISNVKGLNIYKIMNVPLAIGISLNRFNNEFNKRIETKIDIQKRIKLHHILDENGLKWRIHSIICHTGETSKSGHYYSVIFGSDNKWFLFNDLYVPSLQEINIKDEEMMDMIKREAVFLMYTYDDVGH